MQILKIAIDMEWKSQLINLDAFLMAIECRESGWIRNVDVTSSPILPLSGGVYE